VGEARRRGTRAQRRAAAIERDKRRGVQRLDAGQRAQNRSPDPSSSLALALLLGATWGGRVKTKRKHGSKGN